MLSKPDYIEFGEAETIMKIYCKGCGIVVADTKEVPINDKGDRAPRFRRNNMYAEAKLELSDGSYHVTNGCKHCVSMGMTPIIMRQMHEADLALMPHVEMPDAVPVRVVTVDITGAGIL